MPLIGIDFVLKHFSTNLYNIVPLSLTAPLVNDEDFEKTMISAYMTYVVCETSDPPVLIPLDSQCHRMPTKEILQTDSVCVCLEYRCEAPRGK